MFVAHYERTMHDAVPIQDLGINLKRRPTPKPEPIISVAEKAAAIILENLLRNRRDAERLSAEKLIAAGRAASERMRCSLQIQAVAQPLSLDTILRRISKATGVSILDICSERRTGNLVFARQAVMYWAIRRTMLSTPAIGRRLGHRDHTTVLHGGSAYPQKRERMGRNLRRVDRRSAYEGKQHV